MMINPVTILTTSANDRIFLPTCKGIEVIELKNIIRVEAISSYSKLFFSNGKTLVVAKVLRWIEERLSSQQFIRVHRTHLINRDFIHQYLKGERYKVELLNGECIDVAKRKRTNFLRHLNTAA